MNTTAKRIVACCLLIAFALVLGACGADNTGMNNVVLVSIIGGGTAATADNSGSATPATTASGGTVTSANTDTPATTAAQTPATTAAGQTPATTAAATPNATTVAPAADATTTAPAPSDGGLTSTDANAVVDFYKTAFKNTEASSNSCTQAMTLDELDGGEGGAGTFINLAKPIITSAIDGNNKEVDWLPGHIDLLVGSDCSKASATSDGSKTTIRMDFPEQTDPAKSSSDNGPVGHAISTLGDIDSAISSLGGITVDYSNGEISLKYYDAYIDCTIDNATKTITSAKWHYKVYVTINNVNAKVSFISVTLNGAHAIIDYTLTK